MLYIKQLTLAFVYSIRNKKNLTYGFVGNSEFVGKPISCNILAIQSMMIQMSLYSTAGSSKRFITLYMLQSQVIC